MVAVASVAIGAMGVFVTSAVTIGVILVGAVG